MPLLGCILWVIILVVIAGVLVWALSAIPALDPTIRQVGKVVIIVLFVICLLLVMLNCLGLSTGHYGLPPMR